MESTKSRVNGTVDARSYGISPLVPLNLECERFSVTKRHEANPRNQTGAFARKPKAVSPR